MHFGKNIKLLRKRKKLSQDLVAQEIGVTRTSLSGYESSAVQPPLRTLLALSDFFNIPTDSLLRHDLSELDERTLREMEQGLHVDIKGKKLRVLATSVGLDNEENIELVQEKARAGYTAGYADPEYLKELPTFRLPFLSNEKKYRAFRIAGDSMPPLQPEDIVVGSYVQDWSQLREGEEVIVITAEEGVVYKKAYPKWDGDAGLLLVSTNPAYAPYFTPFSEVIEVWRYVCHVSNSNRDGAYFGDLNHAITQLQRQVAELQRSHDAQPRHFS